MMAFLAIVRDSFREATDRRISTFMLIASAVFSGAFLLVGLEEVPVEDLVRSSLREAGVAGRVAVGAAGARAVVLAAQERLPPGGEEGHEGRLADPLGERVSHAAESVRIVLERRGVRSVTVGEARGPFSDRTPRLRLALDYEPLDVLGATRVRTAFGSRRFDLGPEWGGRASGFTGREFTVLFLEMLVPNLVAGFAGLILAVIATAGFVPSMVAGGAAHLLLAKPVRRTTLLLGKYAGGVAFTAFHSLVVTALSLATIGISTGIWDPRLLLAPLAVTGTFAILYAVSVLAAVLFETPVVSILGTLVFWLACWGAWSARNLPKVLRELGETAEIPERIEAAIDAVYWTLPKTTDIFELLKGALVEGRLSARTLGESAGLLAHGDPALVIGTSAAFTVAVLALACWTFGRRDY